MAICPRRRYNLILFSVCNVTEKVCELYGFEYDTNHRRGHVGEDWCEKGHMKVRCVSPAAPSYAPPTQANILNVLTYNIFERNHFISRDGQMERTCRIPRWIATAHPEIDVISFQEAFMGGCAHQQSTGDIRALLTQYGFSYQSDQLNRHIHGLNNTVKSQAGGVFVASKWPIAQQEQYIYMTNTLSWDHLAAKGVIYAKIIKRVNNISKQYHIFSTHTIHAAGEGQEDVQQARYNQVTELYKWVDSLNIPKDEAVIYAGDFNQDIHDKDKIGLLLSKIHASLVSPIKR